MAGMIKSMDLANNAITVVLHNHLDDEEEDGDGGDVMMEGTVMERTMTKRRTTIRPDLRPRRPDLPHLRRAAKNRKSDQSPWIWIWAPPRTPARAHFERKKQHAAKHEKTLAQNARAVAAAERAASTAKSKETRRGPRRRVPRAHAEWFEKFHWFVTPENCLVLSARTPRRRTRSSRNTSARTTRTCTRTSRARP